MAKKYVKKYLSFTITVNQNRIDFFGYQSGKDGKQMPILGEAEGQRTFSVIIEKVNGHNFSGDSLTVPVKAFKYCMSLT